METNKHIYQHQPATGPCIIQERNKRTFKNILLITPLMPVIKWQETRATSVENWPNQYERGIGHCGSVELKVVFFPVWLMKLRNHHSRAWWAIKILHYWLDNKVAFSWYYVDKVWHSWLDVSQQDRCVRNKEIDKNCCHSVATL